MGTGTLLIRADASAETGAGHVMRCLALAQAWQDAGGSVLFLMAECTAAIQSRLSTENCVVAAIEATPGSERDARFTLKHALRCQPDWIVVDGYRFDTSFLERIKSQGHNILCIDDEGKCGRYVADIILNQNLTASKDWYSVRQPGTRLLLGPRFCLLRKEFPRWRHWRREVPKVCRKLLVTLGGSTSVEIGLRILETLETIKVEDLNVVFAVGGSTRDASVLERYAAASSLRIATKKDVMDMATLMAEADLAISAAGSTCWELCLLGLPAVLLDVAGNQTPVAMEMHRQRCALYVGHAEDVSVKDLASAVQDLLASTEMRKSFCFHGRQLVDGLGADRVLSAMLAARQKPTNSHTVGVWR